MAAFERLCAFGHAARHYFLSKRLHISVADLYLARRSPIQNPDSAFRYQQLLGNNRGVKRAQMLGTKTLVPNWTRAFDLMALLVRSMFTPAQEWPYPISPLSVILGPVPSQRHGPNLAELIQSPQALAALVALMVPSMSQAGASTTRPSPAGSAGGNDAAAATPAAGASAGPGSAAKPTPLLSPAADDILRRASASFDIGPRARLIKELNAMAAPDRIVKQVIVFASFAQCDATRLLCCAVQVLGMQTASLSVVLPAPSPFDAAAIRDCAIAQEQDCDTVRKRLKQLATNHRVPARSKWHDGVTSMSDY